MAPRWLWSVYPPAAETAARARVARGRAALEAQRFDDAARAFGEGLAAARARYGRDDVRVLEPLSGVAAALAGAGRFEESERFVREVVSHADAGSVARAAALLAYRDAAGVYWRLGRLRTALEMWERVEASAEDRPEHAPLHAHALFQQALACRWLHRLDRVRALLQRLPSEWAVARGVLLARTAHLEGDYDAAIAGYEAVRRATPARTGYRTAPAPAGSADAAIVASRLSVSFSAARRADEARREHARALDTLDRLAHDRDRAASIVLFDAGEMAEEPAAALAQHQRALELRAKLDGATDPLAIESRLRVAELEAGEHVRRDGRALSALLERGPGAPLDRPRTRARSPLTRSRVPPRRPLVAPRAPLVAAARARRRPGSGSRPKRSPT